MAQPKINLYVDVISPFGYLAFYMLQNSPTFRPANITYTPILLGGLHKLCNNTAPIFIKNKAQYIGRERIRWSEIYKIPLRKDSPKGFPVSTVNALRGLVALEMEANDGNIGHEDVARCLEALWSAIWCPEAKCLDGLTGKGENGEWDLRDKEVLKVLIGSVVGPETAAKVVDKIGNKEVKDKLTENTNTAFEKGAFGVPWFDCVNEKGQEEGFWGFDHLGAVVRFLGLNGEEDNARSGEIVRALL